MVGQEIRWYEIHRYNRAGFDCEDGGPEYKTRDEAERELRLMRKQMPKEHFEIVECKGRVIVER